MNDLNVEIPIPEAPLTKRERQDRSRAGTARYQQRVAEERSAEVRESLRTQQSLLRKLDNSNLDAAAKAVLITLIKAVFR